MASPRPYAGNAGFDVLTTHVADLQALLESGRLTSVELVGRYLAQIKQHNTAGMGVRALISIAPRMSLLKQASDLDIERKLQGRRGPMHGIPVIVKVSDTLNSAAMDTTCGTVALRGAKPPMNAAVVDMLLQAGMIIIGKANLSELANFKDIPPITCGWSSAGGQTQSPYVKGGVLPNACILGHSTPGGSSSGSGAGVAAGFAPIGVGSETDGSIIHPATRASLYGMKASVGAVSSEGAMPVCSVFDGHGAMGRTPRDLSDIMGILMGGRDFSPFLRGSWAGLRIGFVDPHIWRPTWFVDLHEGFRSQTDSETEQAKRTIQKAGADVVQNVPLITLAELASLEEGLELDNLFSHNFKNSIDDFLGQYSESPVRKLKELVEFNRAHADVCLPREYPSQRFLEYHLSAIPDSEFDRKLALLRGKAQQAITDMLAVYDIDAIVGLADARIQSLASLAGYAVGAMPLGYSKFNGRAWGMTIITGARGEGKMLEIMSAWESTFGDKWKPPPLLEFWASNGNR